MMALLSGYLKPLFPRHVWIYDFMQTRAQNGVPFRILKVIDEYSRECLASRVARKLTHHAVLDVLTKFIYPERGASSHMV